MCFVLVVVISTPLTQRIPAAHKGFSYFCMVSSPGIFLLFYPPLLIYPPSGAPLVPRLRVVEFFTVAERGLEMFFIIIPPFINQDWGLYMYVM